MAVQLPSLLHHSEERWHEGQADGGLVAACAQLPQAPQTGAGLGGRQPTKPLVQQQGHW